MSLGSGSSSRASIERVVVNRTGSESLEGGMIEQVWYKSEDHARIEGELGGSSASIGQQVRG